MFTKGEDWVITKRFKMGSLKVICIFAGETLIARVYDEANAQLIAQAPKLYEALNSLIFQFAMAVEHPYSKDKEVYEQAVKAIARVEEVKNG